MQQNYRFGGGSAESTLNPIVLAAVLIVAVMMLCLRRKHLIAPFFLIVFLVPQGQVLVVAGVHLMVCRIIVLVAGVRLLYAQLREKGSIWGGGQLTLIDRTFFLWAACEALAFILLFRSSDALINQGGFLVDSIGAFFVLRYLIQDMDDVRRVVRIAGVLAIIFAVCMIDEQRNVRNVFGILGGVQLEPAIREGRIRSQGVFQHAILAGVFGATAAPLFVWLFIHGKAKVLAVVSFIGSTIMVLTSASSTPMLAYVAGLLSLCLWPIRRNLRIVRWGIVCIVLGFAAVMNAPVWFIIARIDVVGSSSGYQRAMLIDQFMRHLGDWWMLGASNNQDWAWDMWDVQNQFLAQGAAGGLLGLVLFIMLVSRSFSRIGIARGAAEADHKREWFLWTLGAVLFSHVVAFFGANYFDQSKVWWFALLAMVAALASPVSPAKQFNRFAPVANQELLAS